MPHPNQPNLERRARIVDAVRRFFRSGGYLEVETPLRLPSPLPEAHIDLFTAEGWVLQPSPEICMKRLLAAGCERIFQISKCFRKAERGRRHLPEMTLIEWYAVGGTYTNLMRDCEALVLFIAGALGSGRTLTYQGLSIDLSLPWERLSVAEAFRRFTPVSVEAALAQGRFDELMGLAIEPRLGRQRPTFLVDYPAEHASLARLKPGDSALAERFELFIGGLELCNGFSELNDPREQRCRFEAEQVRQRAAGKPVTPLPERFLAALADLPACAGNALGLDRLAMLFCDAAAIDAVVAFVPEEL